MRELQNRMTETLPCAVDSEAMPTAFDVTAVKRIQLVTVAWMSVEVALAFFAAVRSRSVALLGFGGDSAIELISAAAVLWRFHSLRQHAEATATKITGWLLIALALYISADSIYTLVMAESKPQPTYVGIALLAAVAVVMPWLARRKLELAAATRSHSLRADAAQSSICAYMSWIALAGLMLNAAFHLSWADPVAAFGLLPIIFREAKEILEGRACC